MIVGLAYVLMCDRYSYNDMSTVHDGLSHCIDPGNPWNVSGKACTNVSLLRQASSAQ